MTSDISSVYGPSNLVEAQETPGGVILQFEIGGEYSLVFGRDLENNPSWTVQASGCDLDGTRRHNHFMSLYINWKNFGPHD
ncbi:MAG: hypothetical protein GF368_02900 [Candidatus Aenigmarchaeota archaeon]|nr:hypothetical protein [Candidatus Aenigmarchaeota archaeon]